MKTLRPSLDELTTAAAEVFAVDVEKLHLRCQKGASRYARAASMYLAVSHGYTHREIAKHFGITRTTVCNSAYVLGSLPERWPLETVLKLIRERLEAEST